MKPLRVAILFRHSLLASGLASRLSEHPNQVQIQMIDAGSPDAASQLCAAAPAIVIVDASDADTTANMPIARLLDVTPQAKVLRLDARNDHIRIFSSTERRAKGTGELIAVMQDVSGNE